MSSEWPHVRLGDHIDACLGKMLDAKKNKGELQPYLGNSNVRWGNFDISDLAEMRFESHEEERYSLRQGDLVVCEGGEPGRCAIWIGLPGMRIQKALHRIRSKTSFDNYYLYYWFRHAANIGLLDQHFTGTTIKHLTGRAIAALLVPLPPVSIQLAMVDILRTLDDRIALLRATNATLESIAQALFKSWFVDFDPVRAKQDGRVPEGMDAARAALFPDSFEESELGYVPRGWKKAVLAELTTKIGSGATPRGGKDVYLHDGVAFIRSQNVYDSEFVWNGLARISNDAAYQLKGVEVKPADVLLNITGASILRTCVVISDVLPARVNQHVAIIRAKESIPSRYIQLHLLQRKTKEFLLGLNAGGSREAVTKAHIESVPIIRPPDKVLAAFNEITNPIHLRNEVLARQERTLAGLRDTLLPRLISGQLRLPEAAEKVDQLKTGT